MSTHFESPDAAGQFYQTQELSEASRFQAVASIGGRLIARTALALGLAAGPGVAVGAISEMVEPNPPAARADTGGYPDASKPCLKGDPMNPDSSYGKTTGVGYWCSEYTWGVLSTGNDISSRGYAYRNCTDWVAWRLPQAVGVDVPRGWHNGENWDNAAAAAGYTVDNTPEPGDIAQWEGDYGHVAVVESVNTDGSVNISEYNHGQNGTYGIRGNVTGVGHFIDLNGTDKGIDGEDLGSGGGNEAKKQDLAYWTTTILNTRPNPNFQISSATDGLAPPYWADVMDYDGDGLDDIVLYRENGGDIKVIRKNPQGGWLPVSEAVRGPNIAAPLWAAAADLDNNGKTNDLIWWSPTGISKLVGEDLNTKSTTTGIAAPDWADVIDYNQDGRDDIVLLRPDGSLRVLLNSASGGWNAAAPNPVRTGVTQPVWAGVGDFNGDGKAREIAWWNASGNVSILDGADKFGLTGTTTGVGLPEWAAVTDYDGDGKDDIIFYRDGTINILRKSPTGDAFYSIADNPVRGPGVSAPSWAGVGDFTK